jgi:Nuclease-related domain
MAAGESARTKARQLRATAEERQVQADNLRSWADKWDAGAVGEERVAAALAACTRPMRVLHDRLVDPSRSKANFDHLVVCTAGIFLIDAKNWSGSVTGEGQSLWCTAARTARRSNKDDVLRKVYDDAQTVAEVAGRRVTPVVCLANDNADSFGEPRRLAGVQVLPVSRLTEWLEQLPPDLTDDDVTVRTAKIALNFPSATDNVPTRNNERPPTAQPRRRQTPTRPSRGATRPAQSSTSKPIRIAAVVLLGLALLAIVPKMITNAMGHVASSLTHSSTAAPRPHLTAAKSQALDDWRIRAGLYAANDQPATLKYTPDALLGTAAHDCRVQATKLEPMRRHFLQAPDKTLALWAKRFDQAVHQLLAACRNNDAVTLHHAQGAMSEATSEINVRYNRILGQDPSSIYAKRVL